MICTAMVRDDDGGYTGDDCVYADGCRPGFVCMGGGTCAALCDLSRDCSGAGCDAPCDFMTCGTHRGEVGDEVCVAVPDTEDTWQAIDVGICRSP